MAQPSMEEPRYSVLRDLIALIVVAVACPAALFGGSMIGCVGQGFTADCALTAAFISPVLLIVAGAVAGLVTRGWTGLLVVLVGTLTGMVAILVLSFGIGDVVPLDPISGAVASVWFAAPVTIGYGIGRILSRLFAERAPADGSTTTDAPATTDEPEA
jgi:hypothetical protein